MEKSKEETPPTTIEAVYLAGVVFSFGLRIGEIPLETFWNEPVTALLAVIMSFFISLLSWFSAGIFIGEALAR